MHVEALAQHYLRAGARRHSLRLYATWALERIQARFDPRRRGLHALAGRIAARTGSDETDVMRTLVEAHHARDDSSDTRAATRTCGSSASSGDWSTPPKDTMNRRPSAALWRRIQERGRARARRQDELVRHASPRCSPAVTCYEGRTGSRQDAARPHARARARLRNEADPVHARPHAGRRDRRQRLHPAHAGLRLVPGPVFAQLLRGDEINARRRRPRRRCSRRCKSTASHRRRDAPAARPVLRDLHAEPIESQGTYPLPEAQLDSLMMKVEVSTRAAIVEKRILRNLSTASTRTALPMPWFCTVVGADEVAAASTGGRGGARRRTRARLHHRHRRARTKGASVDRLGRVSRARRSHCSRLHASPQRWRSATSSFPTT